MGPYTRSGDTGFSALPGPGGRRVRKDDARFAALGTIDELNAMVGLCLSEARRVRHAFISERLAEFQQDLLGVGSVLAAVAAEGEPPLRLAPAAVEQMEADINRIAGELPRLEHFVLPGGSELACRLHVARALARRAERTAVVALEASGKAQSGGDRGQASTGSQAAMILRYLNRLSDVLFALARLANRDGGQEEQVWTP